MMLLAYAFRCDNCKRELVVYRGGSVFNLVTAKRHARETGWSLGKRDLCHVCHPQGDAR
jgi:hypothetical protein